ncbi:Uncharacterised protein [Legionella wadsworthii]|uniref:Uncharacterized protein n=2 Tax=Legionella wadsworthii TaxID=28088 RepID=A0A378LRD7_9GAMM|nr:Uncharacterised protein [Legionella wadsworthii]
MLITRRFARKAGLNRMILFFAIIIWLCAATGLYAATTVRVVSTYPPGNIVHLGHNQNYYLHLQYSSEQPIKIWAHPYFQGKPANAGSNPSRLYPAGRGEALGWFFLFQPDTQVDEVRISAGDGSLTGTSFVAAFPVQITGSNQPATQQNKPDWVSRLKSLDAEAQKANYERQRNMTISFSDRIMFGGFMLMMLAIGVLGIISPLWGLLRWQRGWRIAAGVPAALMTFEILRLFIDIAADPTSHNLWPFEILISGTLSVSIMAVLIVARKVTGVSQVL